MLAFCSLGAACAIVAMVAVACFLGCWLFLSTFSNAGTLLWDISWCYIVLLICVCSQYIVVWEALFFYSWLWGNCFFLLNTTTSLWNQKVHTLYSCSLFLSPSDWSHFFVYMSTYYFLKLPLELAFLLNLTWVACRLFPLISYVSYYWFGLELFRNCSYFICRVRSVFSLLTFF